MWPCKLSVVRNGIELFHDPDYATVDTWRRRTDPAVALDLQVVGTYGAGSGIRTRTGFSLDPLPFLSARGCGNRADLTRGYGHLA